MKRVVFRIAIYLRDFFSLLFPHSDLSAKQKAIAGALIAAGTVAMYILLI